MSRARPSAPPDVGEGFVVVPAAVWEEAVRRLAALPVEVPCAVCGEPTGSGDVCAGCWVRGQGAR